MSPGAVCVGRDVRGALGWVSTVLEDQLLYEQGSAVALATAKLAASTPELDPSNGAAKPTVTELGPTGTVILVSDDLLAASPPPSDTSVLMDNAASTGAASTAIIGRLLIWVPGCDAETGAPSKSEGAWVEVVVRANRVLEAYQLHSYGRRLMRRLAYVSDRRMCLHELQASARARQESWVPEARYAAGYVYHVGFGRACAVV